MMARVLLVALLCGVAAGLFMSAIQAWKVTPLIVAAESFEGQVAATAEHNHDHDAATQDETAAAQDHSHDHGNGWAPHDGFERTLFTVLSNVIAGVAFAMLLTAAVMFLGINLSLKHGVLLGLAGFAAVSLAPATGLSPELPGMPAADLLDRQIWWWGTAAATGIGIALMALAPNPILKVAGCAVILLPHLIGAPQPAVHETAVPAYLASQFAANSLATAAVFWVVLGALLGWGLARTQPAAAADA